MTGRSGQPAEKREGMNIADPIVPSEMQRRREKTPLKGGKNIRSEDIKRKEGPARQL